MPQYRMIIEPRWVDAPTLDEATGTFLFDLAAGGKDKLIVSIEGGGEAVKTVHVATQDVSGFTRDGLQKLMERLDQ